MPTIPHEPAIRNILKINKKLIHFSLYCPRCERNRAFSICKLYSANDAFQLKCEGKDCTVFYQVWLGDGMIQECGL